MGIIKDWLVGRNKRRLEKINRELELLKQQNINPYTRADTKDRKSRLVKSKETYVKRDTSVWLLLVIGLCVVIIAGLTIFSRLKYKDLKEEYDEKVSELEFKTFELTNTTKALENVEQKLKSKEFIESDLSEKYDDLIKEKENLQEQRDDLVQEVQNLKNQVSQLDKIVQNKTNEVNFWKDCIKDELNENLTVCD